MTSKHEQLHYYFHRFATFLKEEVFGSTVSQHPLLDELCKMDSLTLGYELLTNLMPHKHEFWPLEKSISSDFMEWFVSKIDSNYREPLNSLEQDKAHKLRSYLCCFVDIMVAM